LSPGSISRRYARALLSIGIEMRLFEQFGKELDQFAELFADKTLVSVLANPTYPLSKRKAVLEELIARVRPSNTVRNFMLLLIDRDRVTILTDVAREYQVMVDEHSGRIRAAVTSARTLRPDELTQLEQALAEQTKKKVLLTQTVDDQLIAGTVTQIGSVIYDGSVRTRLTEMRDALIARH
jgi:F-type H+-transporting ATPase subunit delta